MICSPHVEFCGASAPHPSDDFINIRIQTTGETHSILNSTDCVLGEITAKQALKQAAKDVRKVCEHIKSEFAKDLRDYKETSS